MRKISWSRKWQPTLVFLPGESNGQRSLAGYSPRDHKESDTVGQPSVHTHTHTHTHTKPCGYSELLQECRIIESWGQGLALQRNIQQHTINSEYREHGIQQERGNFILCVISEMLISINKGAVYLTPLNHTL